MRKLPILGAVALLSLYGLAARAENHGGSDYSGGSVTTVRSMSSTRPLAPVGRGKTVTKTKTVTYYGYPTATYPQYPTYPTYPTATYPTTTYPSYTSMYYPTYYPTSGSTCYSCVYNGTNTTNPYGYSYGIPSSSYSTYPTYPSYPSYPTATYPPSYPSSSYTYSTYPNYNSSSPAYSNSTYYYPGSAYSYTNLSYYPRGTNVSVTSPYGTGSGYFSPTSGSYSGPLGSFYYNRVPGYGGTAGFNSAWGSGSASWKRY